MRALLPCLTCALLFACEAEPSPVDAAEAPCGDAGAVCTIVGDGTIGYGPDGTPAEQTWLYLPQDVAVGPDGRVYVVDWNNHRVLVIEDGLANVFAGTGFPGDGPEGPAVDADVNHPTGVAFGDGQVWIAGFHDARVFSVDVATGMLANAAGSGIRGYAGDGGDPLAALMNQPASLAWMDDGSVLVADQGNLVIRRFTPGGTIEHFAGTGGVAGYSGDGGPAAEAIFGSPTVGYGWPSLRVLRDGDLLYVIDTTNHVVRGIDLQTGLVETLFGVGTAGYAGDGGPARDAAFDEPSDLAVAADGTIYVADSNNHCVRVIGTDGTIDTFAGRCGESGPAEQGVDRLDARFVSPAGLDVDPATGAVLIADHGNHVIRSILP